MKDDSFMVSLLPGNLPAMKTSAVAMVPLILSSAIFLVTNYPEVILALFFLEGMVCGSEVAT